MEKTKHLKGCAQCGHPASDHFVEGIDGWGGDSVCFACQEAYHRYRSVNGKPKNWLSGKNNLVLFRGPKEN